MSSPTSIRPDTGQAERIRHQAARTMRTQSGLIRYALELGLRQLEAEEQAENNRAAEKD